ncbi:MAG: hypothetical protein MR564_07675, partial [Paraprevotella sp.]|nr:hypothetical protein [Paraprevotella sp.]
MVLANVYVSQCQDRVEIVPYQGEEIPFAVQRPIWPDFYPFIIIFSLTLHFNNVSIINNMGFFSIFSREKKETLNQGLEKTKQSFFG